MSHLARVPGTSIMNQERDFKEIFIIKEPLDDTFQKMYDNQKISVFEWGAFLKSKKRGIKLSQAKKKVLEHDLAYNRTRDLIPYIESLRRIPLLRFDRFVDTRMIPAFFEFNGKDRKRYRIHMEYEVYVMRESYHSYVVQMNREKLPEYIYGENYRRYVKMDKYLDEFAELIKECFHVPDYDDKPAGDFIEEWAKRLATEVETFDTLSHLKQMKNVRESNVSEIIKKFQPAKLTKAGITKSRHKRKKGIKHGRPKKNDKKSD